MRDSSFLLLDVRGLAGLTERSTVYVSRTVVEQEAHFYETDEGTRVDLRSARARERRQHPGRRGDPRRGQRIPGSFRSAVRGEAGPWRAGVTRVSGERRRGRADLLRGRHRVSGARKPRLERGVSLEEALKEAGLGRKLGKQYSKEFRVQYTAKGVEERMRGLGTRNKGR